MGFIWCVRGRRPALKYLCGEEEIDSVSWEAMKNRKIEGLVPVEQEEDGFVLRPSGEPLDLLAKTGELPPFRRVLRDLLHMLEEVRSCLIDAGYLRLEPSLLFADRDTGRTEAVCLPVREKAPAEDAGEKLRRLVEAMTEGEEREELLAALALSMEDGKLSSAKLAEALEQEDEAEEEEEEPQGELRGEVKPPKESPPAPAPEAPLLPPEWERERREPAPPERKRSGLFRRKRPGRAEREETVLLRSGGEETVLLRPAEPEAVLIRLSTGEVWQVRGPAFRIGKDPEKNQCCVAENPAVSRHHAAIMQRGGAFYLTDLGSTNLTRLEGRLVEKNVEMRLENGAVFTVADEAFRFEEKEREEWNT